MTKAQVDPLKLVVLFIILAVTAGVLLYIFSKQTGQQSNIAQQQIDQLGDSDGDHVANYLDKCPTVPGLPEYSGCPTQAAADAASAGVKS